MTGIVAQATAAGARPDGRRVGRAHRARASLCVLAAVAANAAVPGSARPQGISEFLGKVAGEGAVELAAPLIDFDGSYVLVHLATNRVYIIEGTSSLWSAPAGTGTGFRLAGSGQKWTFTTPRGLFRVRRKEKDPVWIAPDWYYVERGLRVPPPDSPSRRIPGAMGTTAIYLGDGIAIHGTFSPGLIMNPDPESRRVSHGCIRLTNEAARELYHLVEVGTPVLIY
ncbi:MAG: L,D-transpeptidase [Gemmatimonadetes bacterium]|nr:L,D-transpeptidase [Gemmatimonadota bacterium]MYI66930.1 L,D-transpeptidase [Gemmatimonadota bacterium]